MNAVEGRDGLRRMPLATLVISQVHSEGPRYAEAKGKDTPIYTPTQLLLPATFAAIARIAPEGADQLHDLEDVKFCLDHEPGFRFCASANAREVVISVRGLEFIWVQSYAIWVLQRHHAAASRQAVLLRFADSSDTQPLTTLLPWAVANQRDPIAQPWPQGTPQPRHPAGGGDADEEVATEIALCAIAWILHHEINHIRAGHTGQRQTSVADEHAADEAATRWILDHSPTGVALTKRGLGVAVATVSIAALALCCGKWDSSTHPHPAVRIDNALAHHRLKQELAIHACAATLLGLYLQQSGHTFQSRAFDEPMDWLGECCVILQRAV